MLFIIVLYLIGAIGAQLPRPCTTPSQWEARVHSSNPKLQADLLGQFSYDSVYQRTRLLQHVKVGQTETYYNIISLYQAKTVYFIDMKTSNCLRYFFDQPWHDFGVQADAKSRGEAYVGSSVIDDAKLLVTIWSGNQSIPINETASYVETWTYKDCLPVSNVIFEPSGSVNYIGYYNITIGINDPSIFSLPKQCLTDTRFPIEYTLFGLHRNNRFN